MTVLLSYNVIYIYKKNFYALNNDCDLIYLSLIIKRYNLLLQPIIVDDII